MEYNLSKSQLEEAVINPVAMLAIPLTELGTSEVDYPILHVRAPRLVVWEMRANDIPELTLNENLKAAYSRVEQKYGTKNNNKLYWETVRLAEQWLAEME